MVRQNLISFGENVYLKWPLPPTYPPHRLLVHCKFLSSVCCVQEEEEEERFIGFDGAILVARPSADGHEEEKDAARRRQRVETGDVISMHMSFCCILLRGQQQQKKERLQWMSGGRRGA